MKHQKELGEETVFTQIGRINPNLGETKPKLGETKPKLGELSPKLGETKPKLGELSPKLGEPPPKFGRVETQIWVRLLRIHFRGCGNNRITPLPTDSRP